MANRASRWNLLLGLAGFLLFMGVLLAALGSGVGQVELLIWLALVTVGVFLIVRRYRRAQSAPMVGSQAEAGNR